MTSYREHFPDFDPATMPDIPAGWRDGSWHNDGCPFWHVSPSLGVFVDFASPADREFPDGSRFMVMRMEDDMHPASTDDHCLLATDDWAAVLAYLAPQSGEVRS
jgi:hypothetical protein